jgi:hypothetical protein
MMILINTRLSTDRGYFSGLPGQSVSSASVSVNKELKMKQENIKWEHPAKGIVRASFSFYRIQLSHNYGLGVWTGNIYFKLNPTISWDLNQDYEKLDDAKDSAISLITKIVEGK